MVQRQITADGGEQPDDFLLPGLNRAGEALVRCR
jgi:hypothetical protein